MSFSSDASLLKVT